MRARVELLPILGVIHDEMITYAPRALLAAPRLEDADFPGRYLAAVCRCGWEQQLDARLWIEQGQGWRRLGDLSSRLRCLCGSRQVNLAIREGEPPAAIGNRVFIWR